jgi:hypothetical protein
VEVNLGVLADAANVSREGKLNIMGIYNVIQVPGFPAIYPQIVLVVKFEAHSAEAGQTKKVQIRFMDEDGRTLIDVNGNLGLGEGRSGEKIVVDQIFVFNSVKFERAGDYEIKILVNGEPKKDVPLKVVQFTKPA